VKLGQSLADWEQAFVKEITLDRRRRATLRRQAEQRTIKRETEKRQKRGFVRFWLLVLTLMMTAAVVTVVMFRTLYLLLG
jgi:cell division septal protein FtsQ